MVIHSGQRAKSRLKRIAARKRRDRRRNFRQASLALSFDRLEPRQLLAAVSVTANQIAFVADMGEVNTVTVSLNSGVLTIQDSSAPISASPEFTVVSTNEVTINSAGFTNFSVSLLDQNDSVDASGVGVGSSLNRSVIRGGTGTNTLIGSQLDDFFIQAVGAVNTIDGQGHRLVNRFDGR